MNNDNGFDLLIAVVFSMNTQLEGLGPRSQELFIYFRLVEIETLPQYHLRDFCIRSKHFLIKDKTGQIKNLTGKYIMKLSKLKHIQRYTTPYELDYRKFECLPQIYQLSTTCTSTIEEVFETLETAYIDMASSHSMIEPIINWNLGNIFQHQNGPN